MTLKISLFEANTILKACFRRRIWEPKPVYMSRNTSGYGPGYKLMCKLHTKLRVDDHVSSFS